MRERHHDGSGARALTRAPRKSALVRRPTARSAARFAHQVTVGRYGDLATLIRRAPARCGNVRLVAIDGPGGAGKSLFADRLAGYLADAAILHTDDFASWDEPIDWWHRLEADVLDPMERGESVRYQAYDWVRRQLGEWRELRATEVVLLEEHLIRAPRRRPPACFGDLGRDAAASTPRPRHRSRRRGHAAPVGEVDGGGGWALRQGPDKGTSGRDHCRRAVRGPRS
jgi:hypothetical protein